MNAKQLMRQSRADRQQRQANRFTDITQSTQMAAYVIQVEPFRVQVMATSGVGTFWIDRSKFNTTSAIGKGDRVVVQRPIGGAPMLAKKNRAAFEI